MYINRLHLDDFGCFRNARLDNLDENLVVIGGPQRAGKTTFLQALRQFPAGVGRGDDIPPATDEYRIDAEITHDDHRYRYVLNGHASPTVSSIGDGPEIAADDIFGPVTGRQYRNLYTISLDELRKLPPGVDDSEDLARVLLGGAYGDIAEIPELEDNFGSHAYDIGLTRGDPTTKSSELNDPYRTIRDGMEARKEASNQVDEYESVTQELDDKRAEQSAIEAQIARNQQVRDRLNVLTELFEPLQTLETLNSQLAEVDVDEIEQFPTHLTDRLEHLTAQFESATEELSTARQAFDQNALIDRTDDYYEWLLENETEIVALNDERQVLAKRVEDLRDDKDALETKKQELEREISSLSSDWEGSFEHIDEIETGAVDTARVAELASTIVDLQTEYADLEASLDSNRSRTQTLEVELDEMEEEHEQTREISLPKRKPAVIAGIAIAIGTGLGVATTPLVGGAVGLVVLAVGLYAIDSTVTVETTVDADPYREVKGQLTTLESEIQADSDRLAELDEQLTRKQAELNTLMTDLGLPEDLPASEVADYYEQVVELDEEIAVYRDEQATWTDKKVQLTTDLEQVATLLAEWAIFSWTANDPLQDADELLATLQTVATDLELARDVHSAEQERAEAVEDIASVLTEWDDNISVDAGTADEDILQHVEAFTDEADRIRDLQETVAERDQIETHVTSRLETESAQNALEPVREDSEPWLDAIRTAAADYVDSDAITEEIEELNTEIQDLKEERNQRQEACIELEQRQETLASEEDLRDARAKIEEGRVEFERLGEAYAVNRISEAMVKQLHERLMEDIVHSLVDDASDIFSEITQSYHGIELDGDVQNLEFRALREDKPDHGLGELSRATAEQLFLAVRLARIQQTNVSLPVVLDDAATNFDPDHVTRVFDVIDQLTESHQVFFLTCHPHCVRITASNTRSAQYWSLDSGQFMSQETADTLEQQLSAD